MSKSNRWLIACALFGIGLAAVVVLWPVLFAPVAADDRYWFIEVPAQTGVSYWRAIELTAEQVPAVFEAGRFAPLAFLARRIMLLASFKFSAATSTPLIMTQGIAKILLLILGVGSCLAFVKSLRWRAEGGRLIGVGRRQLTLIGVTLVPLVAVGAQAHTQFRNGWISYPVLTYGAVIVVFGTGALVAWCTRRVVRRRPGGVWIGVAAMIVLGAALNASYELYYVAFPFALMVLFFFPYSEERKDPEARRARAFIGGSLSLSFMVAFFGVRQVIATQCANSDCYVGTDLSLGSKVPVTLWNNFFTSIPGLSHNRFLADLDELGEAARWPDPATIAVVLVAVLLAGGVLVLWRALPQSEVVEETDVAAERALLLMVSGTSLAVAIGSALIMSLSAQAQEVIAAVGYPYRHTVLTWTALALALVTVALAFSRTPSPWVRRAIPLALVALIVLAASFSLPRNLVSNQAYRNTPSNRAIADIHWEIVAGDRSQLGDERRCQAWERAESSISNPWLQTRLQPAVTEVFHQLNHMPYCSTWPGA